MRVFLIGQSYRINQIIYANKLLFKQPVDAFVVLSENKREYFSENNVPIIFFSLLTDCIQYSDITLILDTSSIPTETIQSIQNISMLFNKQMLYFNGINDFLANRFEKASNIPSILHVFIGKASQQFEGEALIYSIFKEKGITFFNSNINTRLSICCTSKECSIFSHLLDNNPQDCNLLYTPISLNNNIVELREYWIFLEQIKPDYVIVQTDCSEYDFDELCSATKYICNRRMDIWIQGTYYHYKEKDLLSYQKHSPSLYSYRLNSYEISRDVSFDMLSKISFPIGLKKYK